MMKNNLDKYLLKLADLFEQRNFNKLETNLLLIGTPQEHKKMIKTLEDNSGMTEDQFLEIFNVKKFNNKEKDE